MGLVILLLAVCAQTASSLSDLVTFLRVTLWGYVLLTLLPVIRGFAYPATAFSGAGGRLEDPTLLSERAATLALIALILYAIRKSDWLFIPFLFGSAVMLLALGKTAIVAGIIACMIFLILQRKFAAAVFLTLGLSVLGGVLYLGVPEISHYLSSYQGASTLTGRTNLWLAALHGIKEKPILGHGYMASRYLWLTQRGQLADFAHMHNGFLDVLYNVGLLGLIPILLLHLAIIRNVARSLRSSGRALVIAPTDHFLQVSYLLSAAFCALYIFILLNGLLRTIFGGKPIAGFMLFFALVPITELLARAIGRHAAGEEDGILALASQAINN